MSYFTFSKDSNYIDYLKSQSFLDVSNPNEPRVVIEISTVVREQIASKEILSNTNIELSSDLEQNIDRINYCPYESIKEKNNLTSRFHFAFADNLISQYRIVKQPPATKEMLHVRPSARYLELFESSITAFKQKDYHESLDEINKAIDEFQEKSKTDNLRLMYKLQGILYMGFYGCDLSLVDLNKAEQAFLSIVNVPGDGDNIELSHAYLLAAWCSYCKGEMTTATEHLKKALLLNRTLDEANFVMSKVYIATNFTAKALVFLGKAIDADPFYAIKAVGEKEFSKFEDKIHSLCESYQDKYVLNLSYFHAEFDNAIADKSVADIIHKKIDRILLDKSLYNLLIGYKQLLKPFWVYHTCEYTVEETEDIVIKEATLFSKAIVRQIKHTFELLAKNYYLIGIHHNIEMSFSLNYVDYPEGAFYIGRTQVTKSLWDYVMKDKTYNVSDISFPVVEISWYSCILFCNRLSVLFDLNPYYHIKNDYFPPDWSQGIIERDLEADGFRLPTEAEWDYAAKGGSKSHGYTYSGSNNPDEVAWYHQNSKRKLQKVAQLKQNELGLFDMSGNVWEWCWNNWNETEMRVLHGGSFFHSKEMCHLVFRGHASPDSTGVANGLRICTNSH